MQTLCEVRLETYLAAGNPFDVVQRPETCEACEGRDCFHRHAWYERYVEENRVKVARFLCSLCQVTVSVLPAFVLPYRSRLIEKVDAYFMASDERRVNMSDADLLRAYWRQWEKHCPSLQQAQRRPTVETVEREPQGYWQQLRETAGGIAGSQKYLIDRYGLSLLRRYLCHKRPGRSDC